MTDQPEPKLVKVCTLCDEPWKVHQRSARARLRERAFDQAVGVGVASMLNFTEERVDGEVSMSDCLYALRERNRGPMGPVGPQGATGRSYGEGYA